MRIANTEIRVELGALVGDVVAVGVLEIPNVGSGSRDYAVLVEDETVNQLDIVCEHLLRIHDTIIVGIVENADAV